MIDDETRAKITALRDAASILQGSSFADLVATSLDDILTSSSEGSRVFEDDIVRIQHVMDAHSRGHSNSNSPYGHICEHECLASTLAIFFTVNGKKPSDANTEFWTNPRSFR